MSNELMSELEVAIRNGDNEKILSVCDRGKKNQIFGLQNYFISL